MYLWFVNDDPQDSTLQSTKYNDPFLRRDFDFTDCKSSKNEEQDFGQNIDDGDGFPAGEL